MAYIDELLNRNETILYEARQHIILLISRMFMKVILIGILVATAIVSKEAFMQNTQHIVAGLTASQIIPALAFFISVLLFVSIFGDYLQWNAEHYIITDRRIIQIHGALNKVVIDSPLEKINDLRLSQSIFGRLFHYGTIGITTTSEEGYGIEHVVKPLEFKRALMEAKQNYERGFGYLDAVGPSPQAPSAGPLEIHRTIEELATLRDRGILSTDEFEAKKREILRRI
jgi:ABC-type proline/glycine betaine transport system permease subunit